MGDHVNGELIKDIAECFANCEGSVPIKLRHYEWANVVLNLIREAGWKSPEDWKEKWDASEHYKENKEESYE
jgi:hypothetical protein